VGHLKDFKVCPQCKTARYCGAACQKEDWTAVGRCSQVDGSKRVWFQRLKLQYDESLSKFAFNLNLRRYRMGGHKEKCGTQAAGVRCH
jgi:hypothetical protein